MNQVAIQQNAFSAREEMRSSVVVAVADRRDQVVCPKPRRLGLINPTVNDHPIRPLKWHHSHQAELYDSKAGNDVLDLLLFKGGRGLEQYNTNPQFIASASPPPPFLCGSPPSRVANPLIQDARFGEEKLSPFTAAAQLPSPPPSSGRKGGCVRASFGSNPVVRIEGFDCLDRDRRNRSIPALA